MMNLKDYLLNIAQPVLSKVHRYRNAHKGDTCYIFGDGISIKWFDLSEFSGKISIAAGSFMPWHNAFRALDVKYVIFMEPFWFYPRWWTQYVTSSGSSPDIALAYRHVINDNPDKQFFLNLSNFPVVKYKNVTYLFRDILDDRLNSNFISKRINAFHGSFRAAILMAIYMGFDHVYLVGCDYTHVPSRSLHWYEKGRGVFCQHENYQKDFLEIAKEFIDITTITLDGSSDFINAITYKEYTGHDPVFRENIEIISEQYLKVLATWPGYSI